MNNGKKIAIAIGGLAVLGVGGYFLYKKFGKKKPNNIELTNTSGGTGGGNTGGGTGGGNTGGGTNTNVAYNNTPLPANQTPANQTSNSSKPMGSINVGCGGSYSGINFPLKKGSCGWRVAKLQKYLGIKADGKFGGGTESSLKSRQNYAVTNPIGYSGGFGKLNQVDYNALPI